MLRGQFGRSPLCVAVHATLLAALSVGCPSVETDDDDDACMVTVENGSFDASVVDVRVVPSEGGIDCDSNDGVSLGPLAAGEELTLEMPTGAGCVDGLFEGVRWPHERIWARLEAQGCGAGLNSSGWSLSDVGAEEVDSLDGWLEIVNRTDATLESARFRTRQDEELLATPLGPGEERWVPPETYAGERDLHVIAEGGGRTFVGLLERVVREPGSTTGSQSVVFHTWVGGVGAACSWSIDMPIVYVPEGELNPVEVLHHLSVWNGEARWEGDPPAFVALAGPPLRNSIPFVVVPPGTHRLAWSRDGGEEPADTYTGQWTCVDGEDQTLNWSDAQMIQTIE